MPPRVWGHLRCETLGPRCVCCDVWVQSRGLPRGGPTLPPRQRTPQVHVGHTVAPETCVLLLRMRLQNVTKDLETRPSRLTRRALNPITSVFFLKGQAAGEGDRRGDRDTTQRRPREDRCEPRSLEPGALSPPQDAALRHQDVGLVASRLCFKPRGSWCFVTVPTLGAMQRVAFVSVDAVTHVNTRSSHGPKAWGCGVSSRLQRPHPRVTRTPSQTGTPSSSRCPAGQPACRLWTSRPLLPNGQFLEVRPSL